MKSQKIQRKFVKPGEISQYLTCPICFQVFKDATRLYCGHTFCYQCLNDYMKRGKTCPQCRTIIDIQNIGIDLLARQIINQLQVLCPAQSCPWKGIIQELQKHVTVDCKFLKQSQKNKGRKIKQKIIDDKIMDTINQHAIKGSLQARILAKNDLIKDNSVGMESSQTNKISRQGKETIHKNSRQVRETSATKANNKRSKQQQSNYDFLSTLFD